MVIQQRSRELLTVFVVDKLLHARIAYAHGHSTVNLTPNHHRVNRLPGVIHRNIAQNFIFPRVGKHFDLGRMDVTAVHTRSLGFKMGGMFKAGLHAGRQFGGGEQRHLGNFGNRYALAFVSGQNGVSVTKGEVVLAGFDMEQVGGNIGHLGAQGARGQHRGAERIGSAAGANSTRGKGTGMGITIGDINILGDRPSSPATT